jgi:hypothetical protein
MANNKLNNMIRQRGQAFVLVLIALAVGSLLIVPTLNYVYTGLRYIPLGDSLLIEQYTADAAIEYGLWQLEYNVDNVTGQLSIENPSSNETITVNGQEVTVNTEISLSPTSENGSFVVPPYQSGIHLAVGLDVLAPVWTKSGHKAYLTHVIYIYNYGSAQAHLKTLYQKLDPGLTYEPGTYNGPSAVVTKNHINGYWELYFNFNEPLPRVGPGDWEVITFTTWTLDDIGEQTYAGNGWVEYAGFKEGGVQAYAGESGPVSYGLYDLTVTVGSYSILVNAGVTETGQVVVRSWQIE